MSATGDWRNTGGNWYQQALNAKIALRDSMRAFCGEDVPYPNGALIFIPFLPEGSEIPPGDFKVKIGDLEAPRVFDGFKDNSTWTLNQWRAFASDNRLTGVGSLNTAFDQRLIRAGELLEEYRETFPSFYSRHTQELVSFPCWRETAARKTARQLQSAWQKVAAR